MKTLEQARMEKKLTPKEEIGAIKKYRMCGEQEFRDMVIYDNLGIVQSLADQLQELTSKVPAEDLFQEGVIGLIEAINSYNVESTSYFPKYMMDTVFAKMRESILKYDKSVKTPHNRKPVRLESLDAINDECEIPIEYILEERVAREELHNILERAIDSMPEKARKVMRYRYGFEDGNAYTQAAIADVVGCSKARVQQVEQKALRKMRHRAKLKVLSDPVQDAYYFYFE